MKDNNIKVISFAFFLLIILSSPIYGENALAEGEMHFRQNQPLEACMFFEKALEEDPNNPSVYNLLGLSYFQLGDFEKAISTFNKGSQLQSKLNYILYYNAGNAAFAMGEYESALDYYTKSIEENAQFSSSFLNRGNTKVKMNCLMESIDDYKKYLELEKDSSQRDKIENLIYEINRAWFEQEKGRITYETQEELLSMEIQRLLIEKENRKLEQELRLKQANQKRLELLGKISEIPQVTENEERLPGDVTENDIAPFALGENEEEVIYVETKSGESDVALADSDEDSADEKIVVENPPVEEDEKTEPEPNKTEISAEEDSDEDADDRIDITSDFEKASGDREIEIDNSFYSESSNDVDESDKISF